ncbi:MAG: hypothetical protein ACFE94_08715 [Candidatus Hodarchaeota archaeon]
MLRLICFIAAASNIPGTTAFGPFTIPSITFPQPNPLGVIPEPMDISVSRQLADIPIQPLASLHCTLPTLGLVESVVYSLPGSNALDITPLSNGAMT